MNFKEEQSKKVEVIETILKKYLPEDIGVYACKDVSPRFHARLNAKAKTYRYRIWKSDNP